MQKGRYSNNLASRKLLAFRSFTFTIIIILRVVDLCVVSAHLPYSSMQPQYRTGAFMMKVLSFITVLLLSALPSDA